MIINIHQLKAAGKTLEGIFHREYGRDGTCYISKLPPKREDYPITEYSEKLKQLSVEERKRIRLLTGHMFYGIHESFENNVQYMSMLRNPIDRLYSYYYYLLDYDDMNISQVIKDNGITLEEFVSLDSQRIEELGFKEHAAFELNYMLENGQTKFISGMYPALGESSQQLLNVAFRNIEEHFSVIGITEYFDESIVLFKKKLGWKRPLFYSKANTTKHSERKQKIYDERIRNIIAERNEYDLRLYDFAFKRFFSQLESEVDNMKWEKAKLTFFNNLFSVYLKFNG